MNNCSYPGVITPTMSPITFSPT